jgi:hypothetical protein
MKACAVIQNNTGLVFGSCAKPWSLTHVNDVSRAISLIIKQKFIRDSKSLGFRSPYFKKSLATFRVFAAQKIVHFFG